MLSPAARSARAGLAGATRHGHDPADIAKRRADLEAVKIADSVERWLAEWQPTAEQVRQVTAILDPDGV